MTSLLKTFLSIATAALYLLVMPSPVSLATETPRELTIVALGDSLTAGYMLKPSESFPAQLEMALQAQGRKVKVVNAGVSGDTTAAGLERLEWALSDRPDAVIVELGANDALRGLDPSVPRNNLDRILTQIKAKGADILLTGMKAPRNWGADYAAKFDAIYPDLAAKHGIALYPFFLEGVVLHPKLQLQDGLHPSAAGVAEIVRRILPDALALVDKAALRVTAASKS